MEEVNAHDAAEVFRLLDHELRVENGKAAGSCWVWEVFGVFVLEEPFACSFC
jgi:hypothetical protein